MSQFDPKLMEQIAKLSGEKLALLIDEVKRLHDAKQKTYTLKLSVTVNQGRGYDSDIDSVDSFSDNLVDYIRQAWCLTDNESVTINVLSVEE
jgi:hypothetical protein